MTERTAKIVQCTITSLPERVDDPMPEVQAVFDDGSSEALFRFYPDEMHFDAKEFIGLTADEARKLYGRKYRIHLLADA
jgi:hypothetical protein